MKNSLEATSMVLRFTTGGSVEVTVLADTRPVGFFLDDDVAREMNEACTEILLKAEGAYDDID